MCLGPGSECLTVWSVERNCHPTGSNCTAPEDTGHQRTGSKSSSGETRSYDVSNDHDQGNWTTPMIRDLVKISG